MKTILSLTGALLLSFLLGACGSSEIDETGMGVAVPVEGGGSYIDVLPSELRQMLASKDFLFVNVHVPNEGEIPGTDLHLAYDQISARRSELPQALDAKIVLYCRSGSMSAIAARELVGLGYSQIYNLDGGFRAWLESGYQFNP